MDNLKSAVISESKGEATEVQIDWLHDHLVDWRNTLMEMIDETTTHLMSIYGDFLAKTVNKLDTGEYRQIEADYEQARAKSTFFKVKLEARLREVNKLLAPETNLGKWRRLAEALYDAMDDHDELHEDVPADLWDVLDLVEAK